METIKFYKDSEKNQQVYPDPKYWGTFTLPSSGWSDSTTNGYYTQALTISGMAEEYYPSLIPVYSSSEDVEDERNEFAKLVEMDTTTNTITAKAIEKPEIDLVFMLKGV